MSNYSKVVGILFLIAFAFYFWPKNPPTKPDVPERRRETKLSDLPSVTFHLSKPTVYTIIHNFHRDEQMYRLLNELDKMIQLKSHDFQKSVVVIVVCYIESCVGLDKKSYSFELQIHTFSQPYFSKAAGFEEVFSMRLSNHPHSIFFALDVDMSPPFEIFDKIRSWVFESVSFYTPLIVYYHKNGTFDALSWGTGNIAVFISDILRLPGKRMFDENFLSKDTWGGEDTNFTQRLLNLGIKRVATRELNFIHWNHPKNGTHSWYQK